MARLRITDELVGEFPLEVQGIEEGWENRICLVLRGEGESKSFLYFAPDPELKETWNLVYTTTRPKIPEMEGMADRNQGESTGFGFN